MRPRAKELLKFFGSFAITLAVLGGLAVYILVPSIQKDIGSDPNVESHLFRIAKAYKMYCPPNVVPAEPGETAHAVALLFAKNYGLIEANLWLVKDDPLLAGRELPHFVVATNSRDPVLEPVFSHLPLAVEIAANITAPVPAKVPIAWTRGLQADGAWSEDSPFRGKGGYIAFFDGHVDWFTSLGGKKASPLVKYGTTEPTLNVHEALPPQAVILSAIPNRPSLIQNIKDQP